MANKDFSEVGHTGGKITFKIQSDAKSAIAYSTKYEFSGGGPASLTGVYAHPEGFVCGNIKMGGIGQPWNPPHNCPGAEKRLRADLFLTTMLNPRCRQARNRL